MQSDQIPQPTTTQSNIPQTSQSSQSGPNPLLSFLETKANEVVPGKEARVIDPQAVADLAARAAMPETPKPAQQPVVESPKPESNLNPEPSFFGEEKKDGAASEPETKEEPIETTSEQGELTEVSIENFKKLRENYRDQKKTLKEIQAAKVSLEADLEKYKTGEIVPGILQEKEAEIERLRSFEKIHNLKASKEYQEKYIKPLTDSQQKLKDIFKDYGVPEDALDKVVNKSLALTNRADLNKFLVDHLGVDELGAAEAKQVISQLRNVQNEAKAAEAEPQKVLERLQAESQTINERKEVARRDAITRTAKDSWVSTVMDIRKEGKITELIPRDGDYEFNESFVAPIMTQASQAYGKIVTELARAGATEITPELAKALAKMTLLAYSTSTAIETRNRAIAQTEELTRNLDRSHMLTRPPIGGGVPSGAQAPKPSLNTTPQQDAQEILRGVLSKRA